MKAREGQTSAVSFQDIFRKTWKAWKPRLRSFAHVHVNMLLANSREIQILIRVEKHEILNVLGGKRANQNYHQGVTIQN